ncbi:MAG: ATP-binding response regulator, partial [Ktedonobacterales bacterium]
MTAAMVLPVARPGQAQPYGLLVVGINPYVALDESYRGFLTLLAGQVAAALANARAHDEERRRAEALAELDRAKTAFFSSVSHEFRTPLTLLLGPANDALTDSEEALPERQRERIKIVHRNGLRLLKLVNTLLDFSRIEAGRIEASYEPTDLATYTAELASVFRSAIERAGLRLTIAYTPLPEPIYVDRDMWEKIVFNLLSNAFKFTFTGEISVRLYLTPGPSPARRGGAEAGAAGDAEYVTLEVRDTGVGIPANELTRIFERFHRVRDTRARTHEGAGIGLSLVRELALLHGGSVEAASAVGEGTTFTVTIPLGTAHLPVERIGAEQPPTPAALGAAFAEEALRWLPEGTSPPAPSPTGRGGTMEPHPLPPLPRGEGRTAEPHPLPPLPPGEGRTAGAAGSAPTTRGRGEDAGAAADVPQAEGEEEQERFGARTEVARTLQTARVLVVDDNADMRAYLARLLGEQGWEVAAAADGAAALALAHAHPFDLVLSDIMMPRLDGFALLRALRGNPATRTLPVILLSARAGEEAAGEGMDAGADDYVVKPFSARELVARVRAHLELARMRRAMAERSGQLDAVFDAIADLVVVYDVDGNVLRTNPVV